MKRFLRRMKCVVIGHAVVRIKSPSGKVLAICSRCGKVWKITKANTPRKD